MSGAPQIGTNGRELKGRGHQTRVRLLAAAANVLGARGLHGSRVEDIVTTAGTSHGTFYRYFESIDALFDELIAGVGDEFNELVARMPAVSTTPEATAELRAWLIEFGELYRRHGALVQVWTEAELGGGTTMARGIQLAEDAGLDPIVAPLALVTMIERVHYYAVTKQVRVTDDELVDSLLQILTNAVTP